MNTIENIEKNNYRFFYTAKASVKERGIFTEYKLKENIPQEILEQIKKHISEDVGENE